MEFSRPEYWSGLLCPLPGELSYPGIKFMSPALTGGYFTSSATHLGIPQRRLISMKWLVISYLASSHDKIQVSAVLAKSMGKGVSLGQKKGAESECSTDLGLLLDCLFCPSLKWAVSLAF